MGSRYGGLKQIDPVGPSGETILDYSVFDAHRAGFSRVVFVIRRDFDAIFREQVGSKYAGRIAVDYVYQAPNMLPPGFSTPAGREKPWGTGHATWCARDAVNEAFAVINADDFYGADSFMKLAAFLRGAKTNEAAMAGFRLAQTLSENGAVSRGVCAVSAEGVLQSVTEHPGIRAGDVGEGKGFSGTEVVSMNCWAFTPALFPRLEAEFVGFLETAAQRDPLKAEFYLPVAVSALIEKKAHHVRVLPTESAWFGITYKDDKPRVTKQLMKLISSGNYPKQLPRA
jgi:NDP-sugar pyrophosphorylase family protein